MGNRREQHKHSEERRKAEREAEARTLLKQLDAWNVVKDSNIYRRILTTRYPRPRVELADDLPLSSGVQTVLDELRTALEEADVDCPVLGPGCRLVDFFTTVRPACDLLAAVRTRSPGLAGEVKQIGEIATRVAGSEAVAVAAVRAVHRLEFVLIRYGRIDTGLYRVSVDPFRIDGGRPSIRFVVGCTPPQVRAVTVDGRPRPAYHLGQPFGDGRIDWVSWSPEVVGGPSGPPLPVYVQQHALDRLYERALFVQDGEWLVHECLWRSLREPRVVPMPGSPGRYLAEYWFGPHKLGYLVVQPAGGVALVRTFLFLTMDGTPEGELLWRRLRLGKADKRYTGLDRVQTFLVTDLRDDPVLAALLDECGCGHLLQVLREGARVARLPGYAADLRRYLRMNA